ncbi:MAG: immunoglobulin domain-containing protein [Verrucomicrobiales bacterium]|nr:immunoglobulin domain-containing protein [Verrucomicrobiales bacterium]
MNIEMQPSGARGACDKGERHRVDEFGATSPEPFDQPRRVLARVAMVCLFLMGWATLEGWAASVLPVRWKQVGSWPGYTRGMVSEIALQEDRLALALGDGGWAMLDVRNPAEPKFLGSNNGLGFDGGFSAVASIDLQANRLLALGDMGHLNVYDITHPQLPLTRNRFVDENVWPYFIRGRGDQAVVLLDYWPSETNWLSGIQVYDVASPGTPRLRGSLWFGDVAFNDLAISGDLALIAESEGLRVVNVSKPVQMIEASFLEMEWSPNSIQVVGNLVYLGTDDGLEIVDIGDAADPVVVGRWSPPNGFDAISSVSIRGTRAYLAAGPGGIYVIDVTRPDRPALISHRTDLGGVEKIRATDAWLWVVVDGELQSLRASLEAGDPVASRVPLNGVSRDVAMAGNRALVADGEGGLAMLDASDAANLRVLDRWKGDGSVRAVAVVGTTSYSANDKLGLQIADISDPGRLVLLTNYFLAGQPQSIAVEGTLALVGSEKRGLHLVDVADPARLRTWGSTLETQSVRRVILRGGIACMLVGNQSVHFLDVRQPEAPRTLGVLSEAKVIGDIAWVGDHLYVVDSSRLRIHDVSKPAEARLAGSVELSLYQANRIEVDGGLAFVAAAQEGVRILDVRNVTRPRLLSSFDTRGAASGLARVGDRLLVADGPNGVVMIEPDLDPSHPPEIVASPVATLVSLGDTATLDVLAGGGPPLAFQWRKNGVNLEGQTNDVLVITNLSVAQGGSYSVVVSNPHGLVQSSAVAVTVRGLASGLLDYFDDSILFTNRTGTLADESDFATIEKGEPRHAGKSGNRSLWMRWRATETGIASFTTEGSGYDTLLGVYTGSTLTNLVEVTSDDDGGDFLTSKVAFNATSNQVYHIAMANYGPSTAATAVKVVEGRAFVVDENYGLLILDLSAPESPVLIGEYADEDWPFSVAVDGGYAYLLNNSGLSVLDVRNPAAPSRVGFIATPESGWSIAAAGGYVIVGDGKSGWLLVDVKNPSRPILVRRYIPDGDWDGWAASSVEFDGRYAYLYDDEDFIIWDITQSGSKATVWRDEFSSLLTDLQVSEGYLYVAIYSVVGESSLQIYDVQDPTDVWLVGETDLEVPAIALAMADGIAYIGDENGMVHAVDVSEPDAPRVLKGRYRSTAEAQDIAVVSGRALVANGASGVLVLDVSDPNQMRPVGGVAGFLGNAVLRWELEPTEQRLPVITRQPTPRTLAALGANAQLSVEVDRPAGARFAWLFNGQALPGATGPTLSLSPALPRHAGTYRVQITNVEGRRVESREAQFELVSENAGGTRQVSEYKLLDLFEQSGGVRPAVASGRAIALAGAPTVNQGSGSQWSSTTVVPIPAVILEGCDVVGTQGRWFYFLAPGTGTVDFNTSGSEVRTVLGVFTNRFSLKLVDCAVQLEGQTAAALRLGVVQDNEYFVLVASADGRSGGLQFNFGQWEERLAHWESRLVQGRFFFWGAVPSGNYRIETRSAWNPLEMWQPRSRLSCAGRLEFMETGEAGDATRFYRIVQEP